MPEVNDIAVTAGIDIGNNLTELINKLSEAIGTTADKVYPWYVKQTLIEGWVDLGIFILACMAIITSVTILICGIQKEEEALCVFGVVSTVIAGVLFIIVIIFLSDIIGRIVTPELFAMKSMIRDLQGFVK